MRAFLWSIAVVGLAVPVLSAASGGMRGSSAAGGVFAPGIPPTNAMHMGDQNHGPGPVRWGDQDGDHDHDGRHHRFVGVPFAYVPYYPGYAASSDDEMRPDAPPRPEYTRTEYIPVPYPVPVAPRAPAPPPAPPPIVRYATNGQSIDIPAGARITRGAVYKYTKGGVNTYTNVPPPDKTGAKVLFGYTEAVAPPASHTLYRCAASKAAAADVKDGQVTGRDCKAVGSDN